MMNRVVYSYTPDPRSMTFACKRVETEKEAGQLYDRIHAEGLAWAYLPDGISRELWIKMQFLKGHALYKGYANGGLAGLLEAHQPCPGSLVYEVGLTAFRAFFYAAVPLAFCGLKTLFLDNPECTGVMGRIPHTSRHALQMFVTLGFREMGRIPGYFRLKDKENRIASAVFVWAGREQVQKAEELYNRKELNPERRTKDLSYRMRERPARWS